MRARTHTCMHEYVVDILFKTIDLMFICVLVSSFNCSRPSNNMLLALHVANKRDYRNYHKIIILLMYPCNYLSVSIHAVDCYTGTA